MTDHKFIYVQICLGSDPLWYGCNLFTQDWLKFEQYSSIWDHLHKWTYLVSESRSNAYWIDLVQCEHKAYQYQFHTGSKGI